MARTAEAPTKIEFDKTQIPEGCELIQAEKKIGGKDGSKVVVTVLGPKEGNAQGERNYIKWRSERFAAAGYKNDTGGTVENQGVIDATNALRTAALDIADKLTPENYKDSLNLLFPFSGPRTVDPFEAATAKQAAFMREKKRMPTQEEMAEMFAEVTL